jgi:hypothetical protein
VLLQEAERCVSRRLWQLLYGDLDRALAELGELYFRHCIERGDYHDQQRFDDFHSKLTQLRVKLSFNQPPKNNICPPANQQQATHATFSETRTAQEKVTSPESQMSEPTQKISPKLWAEAGAYQHSEKSTESPLQNPSAPTSSSSTEKELE